MMYFLAPLSKPHVFGQIQTICDIDCSVKNFGIKHQTLNITLISIVVRMLLHSQNYLAQRKV